MRRPWSARRWLQSGVVIAHSSCNELPVMTAESQKHPFVEDRRALVFVSGDHSPARRGIIFSTDEARGPRRHDVSVRNQTSSASHPVVTGHKSRVSANYCQECHLDGWWYAFCTRDVTLPCYFVVYKKKKKNQQHYINSRVANEPLSKLQSTSLSLPSCIDS